MILLWVGCASPEVGPLLFGAASLERPVTTALADEAVRTSFASSSSLARQILAGAEVDVFLSAHEEWIDALAAEGLVHDRQPLFANQLVVAGHAPLDDANCVAVGSPESVPLGRYTREALAEWPERAREASSASAAARLVHTGQCDVGVLYATDAGDLPVLATLEGPEIVYTAAVTGPHGAALLTRLQDTRSVFLDAGFREL